MTTVTFSSDSSRKWQSPWSVTQNLSRSWRRAMMLSHLMLKNDCLCFRMSSSFVGNNPSLQIHSFSEDRGKCNQTGNPSISDFSTILTSDILILADSSHLPSDEAYRQCLSLPCNRLSTPCYECKPNARHFFDKIFIKAWFCWGEVCLFCHRTSLS